MEKIKVGVYGATGYTGWELIRILLKHPAVELRFLTSERMAGESLQASWPLAPNLPLQSAMNAKPGSVDCVFLCLPHTKSAPTALLAKAAGTTVIDLSADLRLDTADDYQTWYKVQHPAPELLPVVYGLPELYREQIVGSSMIANPGCYATTMLLPLQPLAQAGLLLPEAPIIVDAKSGTTGAGRKPKQNLLFSEVHGNFSAYNIGRGHRHIGEVEQQLAKAGLDSGKLIFTPHLLPVDRGILASIYVQVSDADQAMEAVTNAYKDEALVNVLPEGQLASLAHVVHTPTAVISLTAVDQHNLIILSALDNLLKGAAVAGSPEFQPRIRPGRDQRTDWRLLCISL